MRTFIALMTAAIAIAGAPAGAQAPFFDFHSAFWVNLHHYLHALSRSGGPLNESLPDSATASEREIWTAAVASYRERFGKRSLLFDDELVTANLELMRLESSATLSATVPASMRTVLTSAAPIYRAHVWSAHDKANRATIAAAQDLVAKYGATIAPRLAASFDSTWPSQPIRVDVVHDAGPPGNAYTVSEPTHITMAASDPRYRGIDLLEILFHEASHRWDATLMREVDEAAKPLNRRPPRDLWHALLFFNAGAITSETLAAAGIRDYQMYADKQKLFGRVWQIRPAIARHWPAFLAGTITRKEAIARIVREP